MFLRRVARQRPDFSRGFDIDILLVSGPMRCTWSAVAFAAAWALAACSAGPSTSAVTDAADSDGGTTSDGPTTDAAPLPDGGVVPSTGVTIIVEPNGNGGSELRTAISAATKSVYMTMYQLDDAKVIAALVARKAAGKDVQVILDGSSTNRTWNQPAYDQLHTAGVGVVWSNPAFTYTHEKAVIIDAAEAWIMTMNCNTSSPKYNREFLARDTDAADVAEATAIFKADHALQSIAPTGSLVVALEDETFSDTHTNGIVDAVVRAAKRGVQVRIVISNQTLVAAETSANTAVKQAGGHIVMTGPTSGNGTQADPYIHAKAILIDCAGTTCARGFVGSENMTANSLGYNRELGVVLVDPTELAKVAAAIATDYARGTAL
jgi:phosphatidylserine/phosphatidylglycerophosphate/cardiolipin synthase-like enzyme